MNYEITKNFAYYMNDVLEEYHKLFSHLVHSFVKKLLYFFGFTVSKAMNWEDNTVKGKLSENLYEKVFYMTIELLIHPFIRVLVKIVRDIL